MTTLLRMATAIIATTGILAAPAAWAAGKPAPARNVTSTILAQDSFGAACDIQDDALGVYTNSSAVISRLQSSNAGEWELDTQQASSPVRFMKVLEPAPAEDAVDLEILWGELYPARFITHCGEAYQYDPPYVAPGSMTGLDSTVPCPMTFRFNVGANTYRFHMGGQSHPGTDAVLITCTGVDASWTGEAGAAPCNAWTFEPNAGAGGNRVHVTGSVKVGKKYQTRDFGHYYVKFKAAAHEP